MRKNNRKLKNFLRSKGVLSKFKLNMHRFSFPFLDNFGSCNLIGIGSEFTWENTPEGAEFWGKLNTEYNKLK